MLKQRTNLFIFFLYLGDMGATLLAFYCAYWFRDVFPPESYAKLFPFSWYGNLLWIIFPTWSLLFYLVGLYRFWRGQGFWKELWSIFKALLISSLFLGAAVFALKYQFVSRVFFFLFAVFNLFFIIGARAFLRKTILFIL
ncbi:MAG: hypothetical protein FJ117_04460 [Deltaproteobacteria bacterium]|nr:hypothetical protein [Deltaproteobacteria bacterium]